jgi:acetate---CoA ligase (ADP-forming)
MSSDEAAILTAPEAEAAEKVAAAPETRALDAPVTEISDLAASLLRPEAVALIGVVNDPDAVNGRPLRLLRRHGFAGEIYPIHSERKLIQGIQAWPELAALPGRADQALILVDGDAAIDAVEACGRARIPVAVVSALARDNSDLGQVRRERLVRAARQHGVRVLGPGSSGMVVPRSGLALTAEPAFATRKPGAGRIMVLAHGASATGALFSRGAARELGFAALVSVGRELDLSIGEIGSLAADDGDIDAFVLFLNGLRNAADLARFAEKAHASGKPILAYTLTQHGDRESAAAADAFLAAHGIIHVDNFETLLELAPMVVRQRPARGRTAAVVSDAEFAGAMMAERLLRDGVSVDGLDDLARERLAEKGVALAAGRVAHIAAAWKVQAMRAVLDEALDAPNNDVVLAVLGTGAELDPAAAVAPIVAAAERSDKPLAALVIPEAPEALRLLAGAGIAAFRTPEAAADGLRAYLNWTPPAPPALLWEAEAPRNDYRVLHAGQAMQIFRLLGVTIPTMLWLRRDAPVPKSLPFPPPYVAKVLSPDIQHPADIGGLALGIETVSALGFAIETLLVNVGTAAPDAYLDGVAIQRVERGLAEVSIRFARDPDTGPVVILAMGEGLDEIYRDRAVRLAPFDRATAYAMIDEVKGLARIRGDRNRARGDLDALAHTLVAISSFALITSPRVIAAAVDPLLVRAEGQGVVALDGWMRTE